MIVLFLALAAVLAATLSWLFSRSTIFAGFWRRYPRWLDELATCPSCSGFWWSAFAYAALGLPLRAFWGLYLPLWSWPAFVFFGGALGIWTTPIFLAVLLRAIRVVHAVDQEVADEVEAWEKAEAARAEEKTE